jgi:hypothetical protein
MTKPYLEVDTEAAKHGVVPPILTSIYGSTPPRAAQFGKGARDLAEIQEATAAQRQQRPGDAER